MKFSRRITFLTYLLLGNTAILSASHRQIAPQNLEKTLSKASKKFWKHVTKDRPHFTKLQPEELTQINDVEMNLDAMDLPVSYPPRLSYGSKCLAITQKELKSFLFGDTKRCLVLVPEAFRQVAESQKELDSRNLNQGINYSILEFAENNEEHPYYSRIKTYYNQVKDALQQQLQHLFEAKVFFIHDKSNNNDEVDALQHIFIPLPNFAEQVKDLNLSFMKTPYNEISEISEKDFPHLGLRIGFTQDGNIAIVRQVTIGAEHPQEDCKPLCELLGFSDPNAVVGKEAILDDIVLTLLNQSFESMSFRSYLLLGLSAGHPDAVQQAYYHTSLFSRSCVVPFIRSINGWQKDFNHRPVESRYSLSPDVYQNLLDQDAVVWLSQPQFFRETGSFTTEITGLTGSPLSGQQLDIGHKTTQQNSSNVISVMVHNYLATYKIHKAMPGFPPVVPELFFGQSIKEKTPKPQSIQTYLSEQKNPHHETPTRSQFLYKGESVDVVHKTPREMIIDVTQKALSTTLPHCMFANHLSIPSGSNAMIVDLVQHTLDNHQIIMNTALQFIQQHQRAKHTAAVLKLDKFMSAQFVTPWIETCRKLANESAKPFVRITSFFFGKNAQKELIQLLSPESIENIRQVRQNGVKETYEVATKAPFKFSFYQKEQVFVAPPFERSYIGTTNLLIYVVEGSKNKPNAITVYPIPSPKTRILVDLLVDK